VVQQRPATDKAALPVEDVMKLKAAFANLRFRPLKERQLQQTVPTQRVG